MHDDMSINRRNDINMNIDMTPHTPPDAGAIRRRAPGGDAWGGGGGGDNKFHIDININIDILDIIIHINIDQYMDYYTIVIPY